MSHRLAFASLSLRGRLDPTRVGVLGHSFGAVTAGKLVEVDARVRGGFLIAAPVEAALVAARPREQRGPEHRAALRHRLATHSVRGDTTAAAILSQAQPAALVQVKQR